MHDTWIVEEMFLEKLSISFSPEPDLVSKEHFNVV